MTQRSLQGIKALLLDLDGVMYRGEVALPGAVELISTLSELGIRHAFVTNNATLTPEDVAAKLQKMAIPAEAHQVVTSAIATADYLRTVEPPGTSVLVVGEAGLRDALTQAGFTLTQESPTCVVVGLDRSVTYQKLAVAAAAVRNGARFVATNADPAIPVESGFWPGAGAIVAAIQTASGQTPFVVGKPAPALLHAAMKRIAADPETSAMVGDQIASDIQAGRAAGTLTVLVGQGQSTTETEPRPDICVADLHELIATLRQSHGGPYR